MGLNNIINKVATIALKTQLIANLVMSYHPLTRMIGQKSKIIKERLGDPNLLPSVDQTKQLVANEMTPLIERYIRNHKNKFRENIRPLDDRRTIMTQNHKSQRANQKIKLNQRKQQEQLKRSNRFRKGLKSFILMAIVNHR